MNSSMHAFDSTAILPMRAEICEGLKIPPASSKYDASLEEAVRVFRKDAQPVALVQPVSREEFRHILEGEGLNEPATPIATVHPSAHRLALYAATVGKEISERIGQLFVSGEEVRALFLDVVASRAADNLTELLKELILRKWKADKLVPPDSVVEAYSPGYCGWHVSGQKKLFARLAAERIGISLNESCLMTPLKSVSGALIAAEKHCFLDEDVYPFCAACAHRSCEGRKRRIESCSNS